MEKVPIIIVQLLHIQGPLKGEIQEFTEKVLLIGRHHSCHVCFPKNLSIVSQHHALIVREGNQFKLIDQGIRERYIDGEESGCFSYPAPKQAKRCLSEVGADVLAVLKRERRSQIIRYVEAHAHGVVRFADHGTDP